MLREILQFLNIKTSRIFHGRPGSLPILLLWITNECNLRCRMCGDKWCADTAPNSSLTRNELFAIVDGARALDTMIISITGGEPLLHPDFFPLLEYIHQAGISANLCTNGTMLTEETVRRFQGTSLRSISVSLDSSEAEQHDFIRAKPNCFAESIQGIRLLKELAPGIKTTINFTISKANLNTLSEMISLARELRVDKVNFAPIHTNLQHRHKPKKLFKDLLLDENDIPVLRQELQKLKQLATKNDVRISSNIFLDGIPAFYTQPSRWHTCYAGYASCTISSGGQVSPCLDIPSSLNVRDMPLDKIWHSSEFQKLREKIDTCTIPCWDTTNTEIAIRFTVAGLLQEFSTIIGDILTYKSKGQ